jgi:diphthine-ammonia ligase
LNPREVKNMKCVALISGGKDSWFNALKCVGNGHDVVALANLRPPPALPGWFPFWNEILRIDELDSFMYQTVGHDVVHLQAECAGLPLYREYVTGEPIDQALNYNPTPNDETEDLFRLLGKVKLAQPDIQGVSVGAILSNYQRARVENVCGRLGLTCLAYLWQRDQKELLAEIIESGLVAVVIKVAAIGILRTYYAHSRVEERSSWKVFG